MVDIACRVIFKEEYAELGEWRGSFQKALMNMVYRVVEGGVIAANVSFLAWNLESSPFLPVCLDDLTR